MNSMYYLRRIFYTILILLVILLIIKIFIWILPLLLLIGLIYYIYTFVSEILTPKKDIDIIKEEDISIKNKSKKNKKIIIIDEESD